MTTMRAKLKVVSVAENKYSPNGDKYSETINFRAVGKHGGYDMTGLDEDNTFAKFTPNADLTITIVNEKLFGLHRPGDTFYVDFTRTIP